MPDRSTGQTRAAFVRSGHIKELSQSSWVVCPSSETSKIVVGHDLRHLVKDAEDHKPLPRGFLLARLNAGTMLVGSDRAGKPADDSGLSSSAVLRSCRIRKCLHRPTGRWSRRLQPKVSLRTSSQPFMASSKSEPHKVLDVSEKAADQKLADLLHQLHSLAQWAVRPLSNLDD